LSNFTKPVKPQSPIDMHMHHSQQKGFVILSAQNDTSTV